VAVEGRRPLAAAALVVAVLAVGLAGCSGGTRARIPPLQPATPNSLGTTPPPSSASAPGPAASAGKVRPTLAAGPAPGAIPRRSVATLPPVPFSSPGRVGNGVVVRVVGVEPTLTRGAGVGDSAGEAAEAVTVRVDNGTNEPVNLDNVTVDLNAGRLHTPGRPSEGPPSHALAGVLAASRSAQGVYVFVVPPADRGNVVLTFSYTPEHPTVLFTGALR